MRHLRRADVDRGENRGVRPPQVTAVTTFGDPRREAPMFNHCRVPEGAAAPARYALRRLIEQRGIIDWFDALTAD